MGNGALHGAAGARNAHAWVIMQNVARPRITKGMKISKMLTLWIEKGIKKTLEEGYYDGYGYNDADDNTNLSEKTYMGEVTINAIGTASQVWLLEANVGNASYRAVNTTPVKFKIDTGAAVNCLPYSIYK